MAARFLLVTARHPDACYWSVSILILPLPPPHEYPPPLFRASSSIRRRCRGDRIFSACRRRAQGIGSVSRSVDRSRERRDGGGGEGGQGHQRAAAGARLDPQHRHLRRRQLRSRVRRRFLSVSPSHEPFSFIEVWEAPFWILGSCATGVMANGSCSWHPANGKETGFIRLLIGELFLPCCVLTPDDHSAISANNQILPPNVPP